MRSGRPPSIWNRLPVYPGLRTVRAEADSRGIAYDKMLALVNTGRVPATRIEGADEIFILAESAVGLVVTRSASS